MSQRVPRLLRRRRAALLGFLTGTGAGVAVLAGFALGGRLDWPWRPSLDETLRASRRSAIVRAVEKMRGSVVTIRAEGRRRTETPRDDLQWYPFRPARVTSYLWVGSGFFIDDDGFVLTNEHVVRDAVSVVIGVGDATHGSSVPADVVGVAPQYDLALLRVPMDALRGAGMLGGEAPHAVAAEMGDSDDLWIGEWAIAIGSPFGSELGNVEPSVSVGVISALQRDLPTDPQLVVGPYLAMIQTDAAIHMGNSGGPLVDATGRVIGVNTVSYSSRSEGPGDIHFAIPINTARWVAQELREYGEVRKPWLGWSVSEVSADVRSLLQLPEEEGVLRVNEVVRDSPADRAGIRSGDILYRVQGLDPYSRARAERILFGTPVGAKISVQLLRDGQLVERVVDVIEDPYTRAEREARSRRPLG